MRDRQYPSLPSPPPRRPDSGWCSLRQLFAPRALHSSVPAPQCCYYFVMATGDELWQRDPPLLLSPALSSASSALLFPPEAMCPRGASAAQPKNLDTASTSLRLTATVSTTTILAFKCAPPGPPRLRFLFDVRQCDPACLHIAATPPSVFLHVMRSKGNGFTL